MKKLLLGIFVTATFVVYAIHQRLDGSSATVKPASATPSTTPASTSTATPATTTSSTSAPYKDGQYTGNAADAYYGYIQVQATISGGKITDVTFLQYPNDRGESVSINTQAMPYLKQEAVQAQSAHVDIVTGATDTSQAFMQSLASALSKAQS